MLRLPGVLGGRSAAEAATQEVEQSRQAEAAASQLRYLELINNLFLEVNPIPVKTALGLMNKCGDNLRMPLYNMSYGAKDALSATMRKAGLI